MPLILFETTESVIEILWDIALAFFIVRIAFIYFLLTFTSGVFLSWLLYSQLQPITHLTTPQAELALIPMHLALMAAWSQFLVSYYEIPRVKGFRLAIGGLACSIMVAAELLLAVVLYEEGYAGWILETDCQAGCAFAASLALFALLPTLLMVLEERRETHPETTHGHEKKSVLAAVPTVSKTGKEESKKTK